MTVTTKFMFDTEFGIEGAARKQASKPAPREEVVFTETEVASLKAEAFENGRRQGQSQALQGLETNIAETIGSIGAQLGRLIGNHEQKVNAIKGEAASLAFALASRLAPKMIELAPESEVRRLIEECLADLHDEPRIVVRASDDTCQRIAPRLDEIGMRAGFQGKLILLPDDEAQSGDCRIEWADGGTERRLSNIEGRLDEMIGRFIRSIEGSAEPTDNPFSQSETGPL
ncbi:MAG: hypothetical protein CMN55_00675 [Sneathiella sp.]|jgi:flagellar assembly protein FliH|uniref:FliH/SctL family protein n=1 Tax=Sneathiella sp. TaxID=1964365 RepID=UPI000C5D87E8|nr:FliH/SctL family protein [Sneathiella sp.]MAL77626.1 hypothetical protein [Sneathiella sp.]|tara:strand:+ start:1344 stop:2030 length:687 start_codon:yes stop_codon:yes gene_type:complete